MATFTPALPNTNFTTLSWHHLLISPFEAGAENFKAAFSGASQIDNTATSAGSLDLGRRVCHFLLGAALCIPVVNLIIFLAIRHFQGLKSTAGLKEKFHDLQTKVSEHPLLSKSKAVQTALGHIGKLFKRLNSENAIAVTQAYDNHALHAHVFKAIKEIPPGSEIAPIWKKFLRDFESRARLLYPDNKHRSLDFSREKQLLKDAAKGVSSKQTIEFYQPKGLTQKEFKEIREIERESFTQEYPDAVFYHYASQMNGQSLFLARDASSKEIVGTLLCQNGHIISLARRANACGLGVARGLFKAYGKNLKKENIPGETLLLEVRASNKEAIRLYKEVGFKTVATKPKYYSYPAEAAKIMTVPGSVFIEKVSGL